MTNSKLFVDGEPRHQPAGKAGFYYREPFSGHDRRDGWYYEPRRTKRARREDVAEAIGVTVQELIAWENATDEAAEAESRAEYGDW